MSAKVERIETPDRPAAARPGILDARIARLPLFGLVAAAVTGATVLAPVPTALAGSSLSDAIAAAAIVPVVVGENSDRVRNGHEEESPDKPGANTKEPEDDCPAPEATPLRVTPVVYGGSPHISHRHHPDSGGTLGIDSCEPRSGRVGRVGRRSDPTFFLGLSLDGMSQDETVIDDGGQVTLRGGAFAPDEGERLAFEAEFAFGHYDFARPLSEGIEDGFSFTAGGALRAYATSSRNPVGLYGTAGVRGGILHWDYKSPVPVDDGYDSYEVHTDYLGIWSPYAGAGLTFFRNQPLQLDVAVLSGIQFYGKETDEGFRNDLFDTDTFTQVRIGILGVFF